MSAPRISILATLAAVLALAGLFVRHELLGSGPISIGLQVLAALLMIWARLVFGMRSFHAAADTSAGELVTRGPYAIVRNPIYAAVILFAWAGIAVHFTWQSALHGLVVLAGMLTRILLEERFLRERYREYEPYARRVKRLVPFVF